MGDSQPTTARREMTGGKLPRDIEWRLPHRAQSVGRARTLLREQSRSWRLPDETVETAVLLLSELVTNAYRHAHTPPDRHISIRVLADHAGSAEPAEQAGNTQNPANAANPACAVTGTCPAACPDPDTDPRPRLRVEVSDAGDEMPSFRQAPELGGRNRGPGGANREPGEAAVEPAESGRGLVLVDALADWWGAYRRPGGIGKTVWFELRLLPGPEALGSAEQPQQLEDSEQPEQPRHGRQRRHG
nr:ATP-binding protein [Streptomyces zingiberis]